MRFYIITLLFFLPFSVSARSDTLSVFFPLNEKGLNRQASHSIDSLIYTDIIKPGENIMILGFADYLGSEGYNKTLSYERAMSVQQYLISSGIKKENITLCIGKGKIEREDINSNKGYPDDRKVQIIIHPVIKDIVRLQSKPLSVAPVKPLPVAQVSALSPSPAPSISSLDLNKLQKNTTLILDNIYFLPGSHHVREESFQQLEVLYDMMERYPELRIQIEGHVCCITSNIYKDTEGNEIFEDGYDADSRTYDLSVQRAKCIYDYLIKKGIPANHLKYRGFGSTHPLAYPERTEEDQNKNRRVEIRILDK